MNQQLGRFKKSSKQITVSRWVITALVLIGFIFIIWGIFLGNNTNTQISIEWKELLLILLGAFISSYGKIIDFWFSDTDKMSGEKMDEEDEHITSTSNVPESFTTTINDSMEEPKPSVKVDIDENGDGVMDGYDTNGDGIIDIYFEHRQCQHVWGDSDNDGDIECLVCGKIKDTEPENTI